MNRLKKPNAVVQALINPPVKREGVHFSNQELQDMCEAFIDFPNMTTENLVERIAMMSHNARVDLRARLDAHQSEVAAGNTPTLTLFSAHFPDGSGIQSATQATAQAIDLVVNGGADNARDLLKGFAKGELAVLSSQDKLRGAHHTDLGPDLRPPVIKMMQNPQTFKAKHSMNVKTQRLSPLLKSILEKNK